MRHEYREIHMGMPVRIVLYAATDSAARDAARAAFQHIARLDAELSDYRPDSELRRIEAGAGSWVSVRPATFAVLQQARDIANLTDGAFDPTIAPLVALWRHARQTGRLPPRPAIDSARALVAWHELHLDAARCAVRLARPGMRLDLGGIAKGFILQQALATLEQHGVKQALLEAGGDIVVGAAPPGQAGWLIETPGADPEFAAHSRALEHAALATSGHARQFVEIDGVRYSHVVDPATGLGLTNGLTARVIAADGALADALATALTVGPARAEVLARRSGVRASVVAR
jgi:thiamine biosynthesis lipoprotein